VATEKASPAALETAAVVAAPTKKTERTKTTGSDGSFVMPNEVGKVLQDAQDDIQRVSGDPVFFSHSHDALGSRFQVLDRDWKVCDQNIPGGHMVSAVGHIDFGAVKLSETFPAAARSHRGSRCRANRPVQDSSSFSLDAGVDFAEHSRPRCPAGRQPRVVLETSRTFAGALGGPSRG
jgi:hypothetical protein